jgi:hypothetical protein
MGDLIRANYNKWRVYLMPGDNGLRLAKRRARGLVERRFSWLVVFFVLWVKLYEWDFEFIKERFSVV